MRQWFGIDPEEMCTIHIKRELMETVQMVAVARGEWDVPPETAIRKLASHAAYGQIDSTRIEDRWSRLVDELDERGADVPQNCRDGPPEWPIVGPEFRGRANCPRQANVRWLSSKCDDCARRLDR